MLQRFPSTGSRKLGCALVLFGFFANREGGNLSVLAKVIPSSEGGCFLTFFFLFKAGCCPCQAGAQA